MIITDEEALRVVCEPVLPEEIEALRNKLEEALKWSAKRRLPGVGLACPQIGIPKAMAIVRVDDSMHLDLVNAKITKAYDQYEFDGEGCLSFPGRFERTLRYREVVVEENLVWPYSFVVTDFTAVVVQHELDHLKGILLPDVAIKK
jgi:peptide deformylase